MTTHQAEKTAAVFVPRIPAPRADAAAFVGANAPARPGPVRNGVPAHQLPDLRWQKSRRSNPSGNCVELARLPGGAGIAMRNSRDPEGPVLIYTVEEIAAFVLGARDGDFDNLVV